MKIYYAHPISIYNTPQEARDIAALNKLGVDVLNPNAPEHDAGYKASGMAYFVGLIQNCDALALRAFPDGSIPAGVKAEIDAATAKGIPIIEMPSAITRRSLSVETTRETLKESGKR